MLSLVLIAVSVALAGLRIYGITNQTFQAAAHLWVGGLIVGYWTQRKTWPRDSYMCLCLSIALSVIELGCFIFDHFFREAL